MWGNICRDMDSTEIEETQCILMYSLQGLPHLLFLFCLLSSPVINKLFGTGVNVRNWMYFYDLKLSLWVLTLLLGVASLAFTLYPIFNIQTREENTNEEFEYYTVHPDHKYFLSPCFLCVFLTSFILWVAHSRYITYSLVSQIFAFLTALGGGVLLCFTLLYWETVQPQVVRAYLLTFYVIQCLIPLFLIYNCFSKSSTPKTKNYEKSRKFWDDGIRERSEYIRTHGLKDYDKQYSSYERAGFLNKLIFFYIIPLFMRGNKKVLEMSDFEEIPLKIQAETYYYSLKDILKGSKDNKFKLLSSILKAYKKEILTNCTLGLLKSCSNFVYPLFIYTFNQFFLSDEPQLKGYLLALLYTIYTQACSFFWNIFDIHEHTNYRSIWNSLSHLIYTKTLKLTSRSRQKYTAGEITNLLAIDGRSAAEGIANMKNLVFIPVQIIITLYLIYRLVGWIFVIGLIIVILGNISNSILTNFEGKYNKQKMGIIDERMKDTGAFINNAKLIKMFAWEEKFLNKINISRRKEMDLRKIEMTFRVLTLVQYFSIPLLINLCIFGYYYSTSESLKSGLAFTLICYIELIRYPMHNLAYTISSIVMGYVSQSRILAFINCKGINTQEYITREKDKGEIALRITGSYKWEDETYETYEMNRDENIYSCNSPTKHINPRFELSDINLDIKKGEFIAIVGATASGKSSLLSCILGELQPRDPESQIYINGCIAYSGQNPWIQNATLKENILFGREYNNTKFREIMRICGLDIDVRAFKHGEDTLIGEKGITLSGGQKARVALARAVYSEHEIYLLDDILSAVDAHVAKLIMGDCLLGYLGGYNYTRVLVTHNLQILPHVHRIIVLKEGRVVAFDTFTTLMEGDQFRFNYEEGGGMGMGMGMGNIGNIGTNYNYNHDDIELKLKKEISLSEQFSDSEHLHPSQHQKAEELSEQEDRNTGRVTCSMYHNFASALGHPIFALLLLLFFIFNVIWRVSDYMLMKWVEISDEGGGKEDYNPYAIAFFAIGAVFPFYMFLAFLTNQFAILKVSKKIHFDMLTRIAYAPINIFFDITPAGRILNRISKDLDFIDNRFGYVLQILLICLSSTLTIGIFNIIAIPYSALGIPFILISQYYFQKFYLRSSREISRLKSIGRSPLVQHFAECVAGSEVIRAFNYSHEFKSKNLKLLSEAMRPEFANASGKCMMSIFNRLNCCIWIAILAFCLVKYKNDLSPSYATLILTYIFILIDYLFWFFSMLSEVESAMVSFERCHAYTQIPQEKECRTPKTPKEHPCPWPSEGGIRIEEYSMKYRPNTELVLKGISVEIRGGEKIGVVGRTGAGKSSLTLGLLRIVEGEGGQIIIDNRNIADVPLRDLRTALTIIPQDGFLFNGTIRENLDPFREYADYLVEEALTKVNLTGFIKDKGGLNTEIKDNGENMSNGEKQLISIARAILKKSKIILLDEATASLDIELDDLIQTLIKTEFSDSTLITIAHRIHTILHYDRILVLDEGKIAEFGTPQNLLKMENSIFAMLAKQATHYSE